MAPSTQSPGDRAKDFDIRGKMSKEHHSEWIEALRSGGYLQGQSALQSEDEDTQEETFCCLGVFLHLRASEAPGEDVWEGGREEEMLFGEAAQEWGLQLNADQENQVLQSYLAHLNDNDRSFEEIAQWLADNEYWVTGDWENDDGDIRQPTKD